MQQKMNFAAVFAVMILLLFSYISFLGLVYWKNGDLMVPIILTLLFMCLVMALVLAMCKAKASRWLQLGKVGQIVFGVIIFCLFILAAIPFTNFLRVATDSDDIELKVRQTCKSAVGLDDAYEQYVNNRTLLYKDSLGIICAQKAIMPDFYNERVRNAAGITDQEKIDNIAECLTNHLIPDSTETIIAERHSWLKRAQNSTVWNPLMASNIRHLDEVVNGWMENYRELASVKFIGEHPETFDYPDFKSRVSELTKTYSVMQAPSFLSIIIALVCYFIMLLPYLLTEKSLASKESENTNKYE